MTDEVREKLYQCMDKYNVTLRPTGKLTDLRYEVDSYSPIYEPIIKQAVQYKRVGNYDEAIRCYIKIFNEAKCFNTEIVRYLCKVLICDGELLLAANWLGAAYETLVKECGPRPNPFVPSIPWAQFQDALDLINACVDLQETKNLKPFCDYVASIAGNPYYVPTCDPAKFTMQVNKIVRIANLYRNG